jgi:TolB-like protein/DNA-binding winged helix-turn-helix (wHTH) protein/Flp pilus assembly protein TadD
VLNSSKEERGTVGANQSRTIRFGLFEVDLRAGELRRNGAKIKLQEQPFRFLVILLQHPGEIVTREELREQLWPVDTFVDFDHSLNAAVKRLRDALGESAESPVYIETLARRGYRFIQPIQSITTEPSPLGASPRTSRKVHLHPAIYAVIGIGFAVALLLGAYLREGREHRNAATKKRIESLAVLPFENLSRDPEQEYFSDGMTDALIADLSKIHPLRIISRTSTVHYKGTKKSLPEIARELNVDAVIEGSVLRSGQRVRINVELIEADSDRHLWADSYDRELGDILKLHGEVAQAIAKQVRIQLAPEEQARFRATPTVNQAAYEDYLRASFYLNGAPNYESLKMARQLFESSVQKDPTFALAYAGLAGSYLTLGMQRRIPPQDAYRHGGELIHKALELDEMLPEAHSSLGEMTWQYEWNWQNAEREFQRALELNPSCMWAHESLGWFLSWSGRRDEALAEFARMRELDPAFPMRYEDLSGLHYHLREYRDLVNVSQKGVMLNPGEWSSHYFLGSGYLGLGRKSEAISEFQKAVELSQADSDPVASLAYTYAVAGKGSDAQKILEDLKLKSKTSYVSPYMIGVIWSGLGNKDQAFEFLERSYEEKSPDLAYFIKADLRLDSLRGDHRFGDLFSRVNFPK